MPSFFFTYNFLALKIRFRRLNGINIAILNASFTYTWELPNYFKKLIDLRFEVPSEVNTPTVVVRVVITFRRKVLPPSSKLPDSSNGSFNVMLPKSYSDKRLESLQGWRAPCKI